MSTTVVSTTISAATDYSLHSVTAPAQWWLGIDFSAFTRWPCVRPWSVQALVVGASGERLVQFVCLLIAKYTYQGWRKSSCMFWKLFMSQWPSLFFLESLGVDSLIDPTFQTQNITDHNWSRSDIILVCVLCILCMHVCMCMYVWITVFATLKIKTFIHHVLLNFCQVWGQLHCCVIFTITQFLCYCWLNETYYHCTVFINMY